jgi:IS5 family transposase
VLVSAGNDNERPYLVPLIDRLPAVLRAALADRPDTAQLFADRGYDSLALNEQIRQRGLDPRISRRRFRHRDSDAQQPASKRDPLGRYRWPIERTNSWLLAWRRLAVRWERRSELYLALAQLVVIVVLLRYDLG